jgi:hypothetical protein
MALLAIAVVVPGSGDCPIAEDLATGLAQRGPREHRSPAARPHLARALPLAGEGEARALKTR